MANGEQWRNKGFSIMRINLIAALSCKQALLMGLVQSIILIVPFTEPAACFRSRPWNFRDELNHSP